MLEGRLMKFDVGWWLTTFQQLHLIHMPQWLPRSRHDHSLEFSVGFVLSTVWARFTRPKNLESWTAHHFFFYHENCWPLYCFTEALISLACPKKRSPLIAPPLKSQNQMNISLNSSSSTSWTVWMNWRRRFTQIDSQIRGRILRTCYLLPTSHILPAFQLFPQTHNTFN